MPQDSKPNQPPRLRANPLADQFIDVNHLYTVAALRARLGLQTHAWRYIRRKIRVLEIGRKQFVLGRDFVEFLEKSQQSPTSPSSPSP